MFQVALWKVIHWSVEETYFREYLQEFVYMTALLRN